MFEELSRNVRFRKWLESIARGGDEAYPDADSIAEDARAFLDRWDQVRKDHRGLEQRHREVLSALATLVDGNVADGEEALLGQLQQRLKSSADRERRAETDAGSAAARLRAELDHAGTELAETRAELEQTHAALGKERRKLDPVLRYAYNLRKLLQAIQTAGRLTPHIQSHIEKLLAAGGVSAHEEARKAS